MRIACAAFLSATVGGQDSDFMIVYGVRLQLGMPESAARRQLEGYTITDGGMVIGGGESIGSVSFKNGRLAWATKEWTQGFDQRASVDVIRRLIGVVGAQRSCMAGTTTEEHPSLRRSLLVFQCSSNRQIDVSISETPGSVLPFVTVTEYYAPRRHE